MSVFPMNLRKVIERAAIDRDYTTAVAATRSALGVNRQVRAEIIVSMTDQDEWFRMPVTHRRALLADFAATAIRNMCQ